MKAASVPALSVRMLRRRQLGNRARRSNCRLYPVLFGISGLDHLLQPVSEFAKENLRYDPGREGPLECLTRRISMRSRMLSQP